MSAGSHVQFQLIRDAGTFNCEGWFKDGKGSGHFVFSASPAFAAELQRRLAEQHAPYHELEEEQTSLETVYLKAMGEAPAANFARTSQPDAVACRNWARGRSSNRLDRINRADTASKAGSWSKLINRAAR